MSVNNLYSHVQELLSVTEQLFMSVWRFNVEKYYPLQNKTYPFSSGSQTHKVHDKLVQFRLVLLKAFVWWII